MARILFNLAYPGYLRLYGSTVLALAARGHEVLLAYDKAKNVPGERPLPDGAPPSVRRVADVPEHGGPWREFLVALGCTADYTRFLSPRIGTPYLRGRMAKYLPSPFAGLGKVERLPEWSVGLVTAVSRGLERVIPVDARLVRFLEEIRPDVVVVTPLVTRGPSGVQQTQLVKAARRVGCPVALGVGSWDHLSSKGLIRVQPDRVIVWNDIQRREAMEMHAVPAARIVVTGAQPFDGWFGRRPTCTREEFLARVGLPADRPVLLYVGSSRGIAKPERELRFVREWAHAIRRSDDPAVRGASLLIRPHYSNMDAWRDAEIDLPAVSIWPRQRPSLPMTEADASDYFHSIYFSNAVVGINTSAMIEATIIGRPVHTIERPEFADTQRGTIHFHYLVEQGGCIMTTERFEVHGRQVARSLADPDAGRAERLAFLRHFVRPNGLDRPAVDFVADAIEGLIPARDAADARSRVAL